MTIPDNLGEHGSIEPDVDAVFADLSLPPQQ
jgi:hypothetical protein